MANVKINLGVVEDGKGERGKIVVWMGKERMVFDNPAALQQHINGLCQRGNTVEVAFTLKYLYGIS